MASTNSGVNLRGTKHSLITHNDESTPGILFPTEMNVTSVQLWDNRNAPYECCKFTRVCFLFWRKEIRGLKLSREDTNVIPKTSTQGNVECMVLQVLVCETGIKGPRNSQIWNKLPANRWLLLAFAEKRQEWNRLVSIECILPEFTDRKSKKKKKKGAEEEREISERCHFMTRWNWFVFPVVFLFSGSQHTSFDFKQKDDTQIWSLNHFTEMYTRA